MAPSFRLRPIAGDREKARRRVQAQNEARDRGGSFSHALTPLKQARARGRPTFARRSSPKKRPVKKAVNPYRRVPLGEARRPFSVVLFNGVANFFSGIYRFFVPRKPRY